MNKKNKLKRCKNKLLSRGSPTIVDKYSLEYFMYEKDVFHLFYDFYALIYMDVFCGETGYNINHANKAKQITERMERKAEELYTYIYFNLLYSANSELEHAQRSMAINDDFHSDEQDELRDNIPYNFISKGDNYSLRLMYRGFSELNWEPYYGGPKWAKATNYLINTPNTIKQKIQWIDEVLDLQHNTGFILNKTSLACLSSKRKDTACHSDKRLSALDFRAQASLEELVSRSSSTVKKLYIANKNLLPRDQRSCLPGKK